MSQELPSGHPQCTRDTAQTNTHGRRREKSQNPAEFKNDKCSFIAPYSRLGMEVRRLQPRGRVVRNLIHTKQKPFPQVPEKTEGA